MQGQAHQSRPLLAQNAQTAQKVPQMQPMLNESPQNSQHQPLLQRGQNQPPQRPSSQGPGSGLQQRPANHNANNPPQQVVQTSQRAPQSARSGQPQQTAGTPQRLPPGATLGSAQANQNPNAGGQQRPPQNPSAQRILQGASQLGGSQQLNNGAIVQRPPNFVAPAGNPQQTSQRPPQSQQTGPQQQRPPQRMNPTQQAQQSPQNNLMQQRAPQGYPQQQMPRPPLNNNGQQQPAYPQQQVQRPTQNISGQRPPQQGAPQSLGQAPSQSTHGSGQLGVQTALPNHPTQRPIDQQGVSAQTQRPLQTRPPPNGVPQQAAQGGIQRPLQQGNAQPVTQISSQDNQRGFPAQITPGNSQQQPSGPPVQKFQQRSQNVSASQMPQAQMPQQQRPQNVAQIPPQQTPPSQGPMHQQGQPGVRPTQMAQRPPQLGQIPPGSAPQRPQQQTPTGVGVPPQSQSRQAMPRPPRPVIPQSETVQTPNQGLPPRPIQQTAPNQQQQQPSNLQRRVTSQRPNSTGDQSSQPQQRIQQQPHPQTVAIPRPAALDEDVPSDDITDETTKPAESIVEEEPLKSKDDEDTYGDDFEDYDDDFEPLDEPVDPHIFEVQKALLEENQRASSTPDSSSPHVPRTLHSASPLGRIASSSLESRLKAQRQLTPDASRELNLPPPKQPRQLSAAESQRKKRAEILGKLIELDIAIYTLYDRPPMNEYELYIRSYGASNTAQVAVQTNEDLVEKGMQTEDWFIEDKWIQAPAENFVECDSEYPSLPWLEERKVPKKTSKKSDGRDQSKQEFERKMIKALSKVDSQRLSRFLNGASKVMEAILEENEIAAGFTGSFETKSSIKIGEAFTTLAKLPILEGRGLRCLEYSPVDSRMFLTAWTKSKSQQQHKSKGILCLWHLSDPKTPYRLLLLEGDPTSCCFSPARPHLAFAGTEDGSIQVWDLKEREVTRRDSAIDVGAGKAVRLQYPSYSTEGLYSTDTPTKRAHEESIVKILANNSAEQSSDAVDEYTVGNVTSQVASFDESGAVQFWTVLEFRDEAEAFKEAQNDLGMWVGGRVKLTNGKSLNIKNSEKSALSPIVTLSDVTLAPAEAGQFVAASDIGIIRESRYQDRCHPRQYLPSKVAQDDLFRALPAHLRVIDKPTTVAFSPFFPDIFAGCFYSGRVALFRLSSEVPIKTWVLESAQQGRTKQVSPPPVKCVRWSAHRPAVFFVLDQESGLHVWDLMESDRGPHYTMDLTLMGKAKATMFALSGNAAHTKGHPVESSSHECLMLGYENGVIEAHKLTTELVEPTIDEEQRFKEYLEKL